MKAKITVRLTDVKVRQWGVSSIGRAVSVSITRLQVRVLYSPLTFKLNQMNVNDIEVNDFIELTPKESLDWIEIQQAMKVLDKHGYLVDNMWNIVDVTMHFDCTDEQAKYILDRVLSSESVNSDIWETITNECNTLNLKPIE